MLDKALEFMDKPMRDMKIKYLILMVVEEAKLQTK